MRAFARGAPRLAELITVSAAPPTLTGRRASVLLGATWSFGHRDSTGPDVEHAWQAADARRYAGTMAPDSGDDPYITWPPHQDPEVEELFRQANRDEYVIWFHEGVYTLVSPDGTKDFQFLGRVVASSGVWRHMISELRDWLEQTSKR